MTTEEKHEKIESIKSDANEAKSRLIDLMYELRDIGANREANSLETIVCKLEVWQNR